MPRQCSFISLCQMPGIVEGLREQIHLGCLLKIQKDKHKILISIYWLFFTSILCQLRWREKSCAPRAIEARKQRQTEGQGGRRMVPRPRPAPNPWRPQVVGLAEPSLSLHRAPHQASLVLLPCPECLGWAPLSECLLHRL